MRKGTRDTPGTHGVDEWSTAAQDWASQSMGKDTGSLEFCPPNLVIVTKF